ncbi:unnamed protein product [Leptidea sinapis]|uniref:Uncharacterized protein n=1 Tax=Leptidea sinapis TaxID=189913 RepID=A0A5E4QSQ2_9NEOP|nr:unnamed protein product [Leptidea sinapis]
MAGNASLDTWSPVWAGPAPASSART